VSLFISYRREDCQGEANGLHDGLSQRMPGARVFMDVDSIPPGVEFEQHIREAIEACDAVVALIGDDWLSVTDARGRRRIDNPNDFVRLEIEAALRRGVPVLPVLVEGAEMPRVDKLPEEIARLARINAFELNARRWRPDMARLVSVIEEAVARGRHTGPADAVPWSPEAESGTAREDGGAAEEVTLPSRVTDAWLRAHVGTMSGGQLEALSDALRQRRWSEGELIDRRLLPCAPVRPSGSLRAARRRAPGAELLGATAGDAPLASRERPESRRPRARCARRGSALPVLDQRRP
jgi:hypothetical protein